ncbi:MAG TPA: histidine kinase [Nostocaceae cyanobacterium]|nr:histidine kinase [Nostocaceae cyanobacterium]
MVIGLRKRAVGVFSHRRDVEAALHELKNSGFDMDKVSVIARDKDFEHIEGQTGRERREETGNKADEGATAGAVSGGVLGGLTGLLVGLGTLALPGIGPIMLAGAAATTLATTIAGAGIGAVAGGLIGALIGLGIPEHRARVYHDRVHRGDYLIIVEGTDAEIAQARAILERYNIEELDIYDHPGDQGEATEVIRPDVATAPVTQTTEVIRPDARTAPVTQTTQQAIGYFALRQDAEAAIRDLRAAGFPLGHISVIHRERSLGDAFSGIHLSDRFDPVRLGLPDQRTRFYQERIHQGDYIIIVSGTEAEINQATSIFNRHGIQQWQVYQANGHRETLLQTHKRAIGVFSHRRDAEAALSELRNARFPMSQVSLIAKDTHNGGQRQPTTGNKADEGVKTGAATGGALGGLGGLLVGLGTLAIPGVGPVMAGGAVATALATTLTGGVIGAAVGGIAGGLVDLGIPEERARVYSDRFQKGDYVIMVDGTEAEIRHAETILKRSGIEEFAIFDATDQQPTTQHPRTTDTVSTTHGDEPSVVIVDRREERV